MKSKRSCFNGALFLSALRRFWPVWLAYLVVLCALLPVEFTSDSEMPEWARMLANGRILDIRWRWELVLVTAAMGAVSAMCVFGHMHSERQTSLMCSLPVRREAVYLSDFAAGLVPMLAADVITVAVCAAAEAGLGVLNMPVLLLLLAFLVLLNLTFFGFAALCAVLTGSVIVLPLVFLVLEVVASAVGIMIRGVLRTLVFGFSGGGGVSDLLSPLVWLGTHAPSNGPYYDDIGFGLIGRHVAVLGVYAALGLACALLGLWLYRRRAMETAGEVVAVPVLRPVFRWCMSLGCGLVCAFLFCAFRSNMRYCGSAVLPAAAVFTVLGALAGWFIAEMLMRKTLRVFREKWAGACVAAILLAAGLVCAGTGAFGYEKRVPAPEETEEVFFVCSDRTVIAKDRETILLAEETQKMLIEDRESFGGAALASERSNYSSLIISYFLNDGGRVEREYTIYDPDVFPAVSDDVTAIEAVLNSAAGMASQKLDQPVTEETLLSCDVYWSEEAFPEMDEADREAVVQQQGWKRLDADAAADLYAAIEKDLEAGTIGTVRLFDYRQLEDSAGIDIHFELEEQPARAVGEVGVSSYSHYTVLRGSENTLAWLRDNLELGAP